MNDFIQSIKIEKKDLNKTIEEILRKYKQGGNFEQSVEEQRVYINRESEIEFILVVPRERHTSHKIIMEANNNETNNREELLKQGLETANFLNNILNGSEPILIPILPSEKDEPYYQQLSAECFDRARIDLDIVDIISKSKKILKEWGLNIEEKICLNGYSSSGVFAQRFSLILPELIDAACIGGASGSIPIPNDQLDYPLGIKNFKELFGKEFNIEEYKKIKFDYYVGELECKILSPNRFGNLVPMHDMSHKPESVPDEIGKMHREYLGEDMFERANKTVELLQDMGIKINHTVYKNVAHNRNEAIKLREQEKYKQAIGPNNVMKIEICNSFNGMKQRQNDDSQR